MTECVHLALLDDLQRLIKIAQHSLITLCGEATTRLFAELPYSHARSARVLDCMTVCGPISGEPNESDPRSWLQPHLRADVHDDLEFHGTLHTQFHLPTAAMMSCRLFHRIGLELE